MRRSTSSPLRSNSATRVDPQRWERMFKLERDPSGSVPASSGVLCQTLAQTIAIRTSSSARRSTLTFGSAVHRARASASRSQIGSRELSTFLPLGASRPIETDGEERSRGHDPEPHRHVLARRHDRAHRRQGQRDACQHPVVDGGERANPSGARAPAEIKAPSDKRPPLVATNAPAAAAPTIATSVPAASAASGGKAAAGPGTKLPPRAHS